MEVKVNNVSYYYGYNKVIDNFSCFFKDNIISAIVGSNGSGKSTLLNLIDGCLVPISGYIKVGDFSVGRFDKKRVGYLFQVSSFQVFSSSVYMEMKFVLSFYNGDVDKKIRDSIKFVGLDESVLSMNPYNLSSGDLRRVCFACVLAIDPDLLILDDPLVGLDNRSKLEFVRLFKTLKKKYGKTIIVVGSDVDSIHRYADYVYLIKDGLIYLEGDKYDVFSNEFAMKHCGLKVPDILHFSNLVLSKKNIKIGYRDEINDLIKDVYRYVK